MRIMYFVVEKMSGKQKKYPFKKLKAAYEFFEDSTKKRAKYVSLQKELLELMPGDELPDGFEELSLLVALSDGDAIFGYDCLKALYVPKTKSAKRVFADFLKKRGVKND